MRDHLDKFKFNKKFCKDKIAELARELHDAYIVKNTYYEVLMSHSKILQGRLNYKVVNKLHRLEQENLTPAMLTITNNDKKLDGDFVIYMQSLINQYKHICYTKIPELNYEIDIYNLLYSTPYAELIKIIRMFNNHVARYLLKGGITMLSKSLGFMGIQILKRPPNKFAINWKESTMYKRYLLENNRIPKSPDNPNGEPWLIAFTDDEFVHWKWNKHGCKIKNGTYYRFKASSFVQQGVRIGNIERELHTPEDVIECKQMGNLQKSLMLSRKFDEFNKLYRHGSI